MVLSQDEEIKGIIEANSKDKTLNVYDAHMKPLTKEQKQGFIDHHPSSKVIAQKPDTEEEQNG